MATAEEILKSPEYQNANLETKRAIFVKHIAKNPDFANANAETQQAIIKRFGIGEPQEEPSSIQEPTQAQQIAEEQTQGSAPEAPAAGGEISDKAFIAGGTGAAKGVVEALLPKIEGTSAAEVRRATERLALAESRLREAQKMMAAGPAGQLGSVDDLRNAYDAARAEVEAARQQVSTVQQAAKAAPAAPAARVEPSLAPTEAQQARGIQGTMKDEGITGRASQTTYNERTAQIARQKAAQEAVLRKLQSQGLIDPQKALQLTEGISGSTPSGVMVSPDEALRLEQELAAKKAQMGAEKAQLGQRAQMLGAQKREAERLARKVAEEQAKANVAREAAERAKAGQLGSMAQTGAKIGASKLLGPVLGGLGAATTVMSGEEALRRARAGDYSGAVLPTLEAIFGAMSLSPPVTPVTAAIKGIGTVGGLGLAGIQGSKAGYEYLKRKMKEREEEERLRANQ